MFNEVSLDNIKDIISRHIHNGYKIVFLADSILDILGNKETFSIFHNICRDNIYILLGRKTEADDGSIRFRKHFYEHYLEVGYISKDIALSISELCDNLRYSNPGYKERLESDIILNTFEVANRCGLDFNKFEGNAKVYMDYLINWGDSTFNKIISNVLDKDKQLSKKYNETIGISKFAESNLKSRLHHDIAHKVDSYNLKIHRVMVNKSKNEFDMYITWNTSYTRQCNEAGYGVAYYTYLNIIDINVIQRLKGINITREDLDYEKFMQKVIGIRKCLKESEELSRGKQLLMCQYEMRRALASNSSQELELIEDYIRQEFKYLDKCMLACERELYNNNIKVVQFTRNQLMCIDMDSTRERAGLKGIIDNILISNKLSYIVEKGLYRCIEDIGEEQVDNKWITKVVSKLINDYAVKLGI